MEKRNKKLTEKQVRELRNHAFCNLKSELKFKGYQLTLCDDKEKFILKDLKKNKEYKGILHYYNIFDVNEFLSYVESQSTLFNLKTSNYF